MKITFHIHELGRLKDTSFDLYPFLIFTGDSNLGKSYCAFLVHGFFRMLGDEEFLRKYASDRWGSLVENLVEGVNIEIIVDGNVLADMYKKYIPNYVRYLVGNDQLIVNTEIKIESEEESFCIFSIKNNELQIDILGEQMIDSDMKNMVKINDINGLLFKSLIALNHLFLFTFLRRQYGVSLYSLYQPIIFPPARGGLMGFSFSMKKAISNTGMYEAFLEDLDRIQKPTYNIRIDNVQKNIYEMFSKILGGEIIYARNNGNYTYQFQNKEIPLVSAASSIKELAPLFLLLKNVNINKINLLFEEPESHLHASMQRKLADLLAYMVNNGAFLQITTHSDYMLSEWNNLLRLAFIQKIDEKAFEKAVSETGIIPECALNPDLVGAYYFQDTENGVKLIKSDISATQQIQFDSFKDTINQMNDNRYILKDILADLTLEKHETAN